MISVPQHVARTNGQTGLSVDDKQLIRKHASFLELPQDTTLTCASAEM